MALIKETAVFNFSQGLDTIDDPNQLPLGKFTSLTNSCFIKSNSGQVGSLNKRNGGSTLPQTVSTISYVTSYNNSLIGMGQDAIYQFSQNANAWSYQGYYQPLSTGFWSLIRNAYSQNQQDAVVGPSNIGCVAYASGNTLTPYQFSIFDSTTGQSIVDPTTLSCATTSSIIGQPKVYSLGSSFFIIYGAAGTASQCSLCVTQVQNISPFAVVASTSIENNLYFTTNATSLYGAMFDGVIASNTLLLSYIKSGTPSRIVGAKISPSFTVSSSVFATGSYTASCIGVAFDQTASTYYTSIGSGMSVTYLANNFSFGSVFTPSRNVISSTSVNSFGGAGVSPTDRLGISNITGYAKNGVLTSFYEVAAYYNAWEAGFGSFAKTNNIISRRVTQAGSVSVENIIGRGLGLSAKPFEINNGIYLGGVYQSQDSLQNTYFLINSTGNVVSKYAAGNAAGYYTYGVPSTWVNGSTAFNSYLIKDLLTPQSVQTVNSAGALFQNSAFATQNGINLGAFTFTPNFISTKQTGNTLSMNGGFLWNYDGVQTFENDFFLYPEVKAGQVIGDGNLPIQVYQYQVLYESPDNQANIYRSAPYSSASLPTTNLPTVSSFSLQLAVTPPPLSYRTNQTPTKISIFRWSEGQPIFYKVASFVCNGVAPTSSITSTLAISNFYQDSILFQDNTPDSAILGNEILYTSGGVLEDTSGPPFISTAVFDSRFWGISSEDNTLWYSKQLVQSTPVEMVQDFTIYVPPIQSAQGTIQIPISLCPMDDKLIIFCESALLYISGSGPDNTGSNYQYSEPFPIPSSVGCSNPASVVITPLGIIFQSDNGIWLLGRDLQVKYIGKDVEDYNQYTVLSALCVPGTTEVRFALSNGVTLIFDLLAQQWGSFTGRPSISNTIYNSLETYVNASNQVFQESASSYTDGSTPVTLGFTTGWINLSSALQGYVRAYWMDILATFKSPHTYTIGIAYDYNPAIVQTTTVIPSNTVGSGSQISQWEIGFKKQQCQSFQLTFTETASASAGAGLVISGISLTYGKKKSWPRNIPPTNKIG